jgi:hypothetical protein
MEEGAFPEGLRIIKDQETSPEYSWGDYESVAERILYNIDRLSQFQSPIAQGDARLWRKIVEGNYSGILGLEVADYTDPKHVSSKSDMTVTIAKTEHQGIVAFITANIRNLKERDDNEMLLALAEEGSHVRDLLKILNTEGKLRAMTPDEHRNSEARASLHRLALYEELKKEGIKNDELEYLLKRVKARPVELLRRLAGVEGDDTQKQKREYDRVLKYLREAGVGI